MIEFYNLIDNIKDHLRSNPNVTTVTFGDIMDVDLNKTTMFPLSHMMVSDVAFSDHIVTATLDLLFLDIVDDNREETTDSFLSNNNLQDILNTQLAVGNLLQSSLRRGELFTNKLQVLTNVTARPFYDRFENQLAGWAFTISIQLPNTNVSIC
jgi:hypothetical protein